MTAAGAPPEAIALALEAIETRDAADEARRAKARDKKRRQRAGDSPETVPGLSRDTTGTVPPEPSPIPSPSSSPDPSNNPTPAPTRENIPAKAPAFAKRRWPKDMPPPPGVSDDQWAGFVQHRVAKRQRLTPRAYELLCGKLAEFAENGWPPGAAIDRAVERGWLTVFPPDTEHRNSNRPRTNDRPSGWAARPGTEGAEPAFLPD